MYKTIEPIIDAMVEARMLPISAIRSAMIASLHKKLEESMQHERDRIKPNHRRLSRAA